MSGVETNVGGMLVRTVAENTPLSGFPGLTILGWRMLRSLTASNGSNITLMNRDPNTGMHFWAVGGTGRLWFSRNFGSDQDSGINAAVDVPFHFAMRRVSGSGSGAYELLIDGVQVGTLNSTFAIGDDSEYAIGRDYGGSNRGDFVAGDDRAFPVRLSDAEILAEMAATAAVAASPLYDAALDSASNLGGFTSANPGVETTYSGSDFPAYPVFEEPDLDLEGEGELTLAPIVGDGTLREIELDGEGSVALDPTVETVFPPADAPPTVAVNIRVGVGVSL